MRSLCFSNFHLPLFPAKAAKQKLKYFNFLIKRFPMPHQFLTNQIKGFLQISAKKKTKKKTCIQNGWRGRVLFDLDC